MEMGATKDTAGRCRLSLLPIELRRFLTAAPRIVLSSDPVKSGFENFQP